MSKNSYTYYFILIIFSFHICASEAITQSDEQKILKIREATNRALKAYDNEFVLSILTEDALTTTGNGTVLAGRESLRSYLIDAGDSKIYWIRTSKEIEVNESKGLAWENGTWKGYDPEQGDMSIVGGRYATMWTKMSGQWLMKSQLFVSLE